MKQPILPNEIRIIMEALKLPAIEVNPVYGELRIDTDKTRVYIDGIFAHIETLDEFREWDVESFDIEEMLNSTSF